MRIIGIFIAGAALLAFTQCTPAENGADAYGHFEAREIVVSAEANGQLLKLELEEGAVLKAGQTIGLIDTTTLALQRAQLYASMGTVRKKTQDPNPQIKVLEEQRRSLLREKDRVESLLKDNAALPKQLDDIVGQIDVLDEQIRAARSNADRFNEAVLSETDPLAAQLRILNEQISRCYVKNPIDGTVILQWAEAGELANVGKPLYKIADLRHMELRAYVSGDQLSVVKIGQQVNVHFDIGQEEMQSLPGTVSWISSQAEVTPKIVQTKEERVNLVYAIKIAVENDGSVKIGMPGEVNF
ncbi:MAG: HlyD family efflux transporter periplasmic adaptor subunit [Saprospirales bacterium]|nr:HlyD family efflux transporter periplasmic adaptor subunit [Saprospirales bacterium]